MKTILQITSTAAIILVHTFSAQAAPAGGGFSASCSDISLSGFTLLANCKNEAGGSVSASIDLNTCIVNDNATLRCQAGGNFGASCSNPGFLFDGDFHDVGTFCPPNNFVEIDLDQCVGNFNGVLGCTT
ncbi:Cyanovirin-N [Mycena floridula]|nr:Cyanovirin-N [Mycena floridula]